MEVVDEWKSKLQNLLNKCPQENQFSADKIGLFYGQIPRKSLVQKGENVNMENFPKKD
jgi:hypothetical protein